MPSKIIKRKETILKIGSKMFRHIELIEQLFNEDNDNNNSELVSRNLSSDTNSDNNINGDAINNSEVIDLTESDDEDENNTTNERELTTPPPPRFGSPISGSSTATIDFMASPSPSPPLSPFWEEVHYSE